MTIRKLLLALALSTCLPTSISHAGQDHTFMCSADMVSGLDYDEETKAWHPSIFRPTSKFVLKLKFIKTENDPGRKNEPADFYAATVNELGQQFGAMPCYNDRDAGPYLKLPSRLAGFEWNVFFRTLPVQRRQGVILENLPGGLCFWKR